MDKFDTAAFGAAKIATGGGAVTAFMFGLSANEFAAYAGVAIGLAGFLMQAWYTVQRNKRERAEYEERRRQREKS